MTLEQLEAFCIRVINSHGKCCYERDFAKRKIRELVAMANVAKVVMAISDREHEAWIALRSAFKELEKE